MNSILRLLLVSISILLTSVQNAHSQSPTYMYTSYSGTGSAPNSGGGYEFRSQCLYTPYDFKGVPSGRVKALYIRVGTPYTTGRTGLTTIYGPDTFSIPCSGAGGMWIRIPVTKGNFHFDPERKFAVEVAGGPQPNTLVSFPVIMNSNPSKGNLRSSYTNKRTNKIGSIIYAGMDLGFDLGQPADAGRISNITSPGIFPNPSTNGRFNISLHSGGPVRELELIVSNVTGQRIYGAQFANLGQSFFREIDLQSVAKGI